MTQFQDTHIRVRLSLANMRNITRQQAMLSEATSHTILLHHVRITRLESKLQHPPLILTSNFTLGSKLLPVSLYHPVDRCTGRVTTRQESNGETNTRQASSVYERIRPNIIHQQLKFHL